MKLCSLMKDKYCLKEQNKNAENIFGCRAKESGRPMIVAMIINEHSF